MAKSDTEKTDAWIAAWLDSVTDGTSTMSQRSLARIKLRGGGLNAVKAAARRRGVHLLLITDDTGKQIVAASIEPFRVIC